MSPLLYLGRDQQNRTNYFLVVVRSNSQLVLGPRIRPWIMPSSGLSREDFRETVAVGPISEIRDPILIAVATSEVLSLIRKMW
jgi:hypothetical protein